MPLLHVGGVYSRMNLESPNVFSSRSGGIQSQLWWLYVGPDVNSCIFNSPALYLYAIKFNSKSAKPLTSTNIVFATVNFISILVITVETLSVTASHHSARKQIAPKKVTTARSSEYVTSFTFGPISNRSTLSQNIFCMVGPRTELCGSLLVTVIISP